jgi:hypothetical protein
MGWSASVMRARLHTRASEFPGVRETASMRILGNNGLKHLSVRYVNVAQTQSTQKKVVGYSTSFLLKNSLRSFLSSFSISALYFSRISFSLARAETAWYFLTKRFEIWVGGFFGGNEALI